MRCFPLFGLALFSLAACGSEWQEATPDPRQESAQPAVFRVEAGPVRLVLTLSRQLASVADPVQLELEVTAPEGTTAVLPEVSGQLGSFEIVSHRDWLEIPIGGARQWKRQMTIESIRPGELVIPPVTVPISGPDMPASIQSPEVPLRIASVLEGRATPADLRDIHPVVDVPEPPASGFRWVGWAAGGLVAVAAAAFLAVATARRWRSMTPLDWLERELKDLSQQPGPGPAGGDFALQLAAVWKGFLELQFGTPAGAVTSAGATGFPASRGEPDSDLLRGLRSWLHRLDLAMYAGVEFEDGEREQSLAECRRLARQMVASWSGDSPVTTEGEQR